MIDPSVIPATFGGIDLLLAIVLVVVVAWVCWRDTRAEIDPHVPDTERRRIQCLVLSGLRTIRRDRYWRKRGEETEQL